MGDSPVTDRGSRTALPLWLGLLAVSILINYVDRGNLAVAAPLLKSELRLSSTEIGVLITAFFWTYTVVLAVSGWIVDRFNVNLVLAAGFAVWSLATAVTGLVHGFAMLIVLRAILGTGEAVAFPACSKIIALNVPTWHRGIANALLIAGMALGPAIGTYACGISMAHWGWRPVFLVIGLASLLWLAPWLYSMPRNNSAGQRSAPGVPARAILSQRSFWAVSIGHFCTAYPLYFVIVWLPLYLVRERGQSMQQMSAEAAMFYVVFAVVAPLSGWIADRLIRSGADVTRIRKGCVAVGMALIIVGVLGCGAADQRVSYTGLMLLAVGCGFVAPCVYVFAQALAGPAGTGKWTALQSAVANTAGVAVGPITGWIVDRTGHFGSAFTVCAAIAAVGAVSWLLFAGRVEQIAWPAENEKVHVATEIA